MDDKKVFKFLKTFNKRKLNYFEDYVNSPYFNKSEELCFVYAIAKKFVLSNTNKNYFDYFKKAFTKAKKSISQKNLDKYLSRIYLLALDFVAQEKLKEKDFLKSSLLMEHLIDGDELRLFDKVYAKTKVVLDKEKLSFENLMHTYLLEHLKANYINVVNTARMGEHNLRETCDALDVFYLAQKFYLEVHKMSFQNETNAKYKFNLVNELITIIPNSELIDDTLVSIWFKVCAILFNNEFTKKKEYLKSLQETINQNVVILDKEMVFNLNVITQNYARTVYVKDKEYYLFLFNLYKLQIDNDSIYLKEKILASIFKNIVEVCINLNELDWADKFVKDHLNKIEPKEISFEITNYSLARINFYKHNFNKTQEMITNLHFKDVYYKFALKKLELMVYFELEEFSLLDSLINAFRVALTPERNENLINNIRKRHKEFINVFTKIVRFYQSVTTNNSTKITELKENLANSNITDKQWLISKLEMVK